MSVYSGLKARMIMRYYSKNNFVTIDPEKFLNSLYQDVYGSDSRQRFVITDYAGELIRIAVEMMKYSSFEKVEEENGKCYVDNDLMFFSLNNEFWGIYNKAINYYETEEHLAMCGWYSPDLSKQERVRYHDIKVNLMCERTAINDAINNSQEEKRLLTKSERGMLVDEYRLKNAMELRMV